MNRSGTLILGGRIGERSSLLPVTTINRLGWTCLGLITIMLVLSFPLHCFPRAALVTLGSACAGCGLGVALALITRTRRPLAIYFWLMCACLTLLPLLYAWPPGDSFDVFPWRGAPDIFNNYFELLRGGVYIVAMPFPFARFGWHAPDPAPTITSEPSPAEKSDPAP